MKRASLPDKEPEVRLPISDEEHAVELWIEENVFRICNNNKLVFGQVMFRGITYTNCIEYLESQIERYPADTERGKVARMYMAGLELEEILEE